MICCTSSKGSLENGEEREGEEEEEGGEEEDISIEETCRRERALVSN